MNEEKEKEDNKEALKSLPGVARCNACFSEHTKDEKPRLLRGLHEETIQCCLKGLIPSSS